MARPSLEGLRNPDEDAIGLQKRADLAFLDSTVPFSVFARSAVCRRFAIRPISLAEAHFAKGKTNISRVRVAKRMR